MLPARRQSAMLAVTCRFVAAEPSLTDNGVVNEESGKITIPEQSRKGRTLKVGEGIFSTIMTRDDRLTFEIGSWNSGTVE